MMLAVSVALVMEECTRISYFSPKAASLCPVSSACSRPMGERGGKRERQHSVSALSNKTSTLFQSHLAAPMTTKHTQWREKALLVLAATEVILGVADKEDMAGGLWLGVLHLCCQVITCALLFLPSC